MGDLEAVRVIASKAKADRPSGQAGILDAARIGFRVCVQAGLGAKAQFVGQAEQRIAFGLVVVRSFPVPDHRARVYDQGRAVRHGRGVQGDAYVRA